MVEIDQETIFKAQYLQQQMQQISENIEFLNKEIQELDVFNHSLKHLSNVKEKEMFASLGKGVYLKSQIEEKSEKELLVEVGARVLVKKTPEETQEIIKKQIHN